LWGEFVVWTSNYDGDRKSWQVTGSIALRYDFVYLAGDVEDGEERYILTRAKSFYDNGTVKSNLLNCNTKYIDCISDTIKFRIPEKVTYPFTYNNTDMRIQI
jgi:hypothetical protein